MLRKKFDRTNSNQFDKSYACTIRFLDDSEPLSFAYQVRTTVYLFLLSKFSKSVFSTYKYGWMIYIITNSFKYQVCAKYIFVFAILH